MSTIVKRTYMDLAAYAKGFAGGKCRFLGVVGLPGIGKSEMFKTAMKSQEFLPVAGHYSEFVLYTELYKHIDQPVVIDDADTLYGTKSAPFLKSLCETSPVKTIRWQTRALQPDGIPREFQTRSPVVVICNSWNTVNVNMRAVADRGLFVDFRPSVYEVHRQVQAGGWLGDDSAFDFIGQNLRLIAYPSMRYYVHARTLRHMSINSWQDDVLQMIYSSPDGRNLDAKAIHVVSKLMADDTMKSEKHRVAEFIRVTRMSSRTYSRYLKLLREAQEELESGDTLALSQCQSVTECRSSASAVA